MSSLTVDPIISGGIAALGRRLRRGDVTALDVTHAYLSRIDVLDPEIGAYEYVARQQAIDTARGVDKLLKAGIDLGPLMGIPVAIKDNFFVDGMPTACGTRVDISEFSASEGSFVKALRRAGAVILGKTKTVEFALGITGASAPRGMPRNPCDESVLRVPGGSSSGSAAAMAAGLCAVAVGTDTGGSVRVPAALCGCVGLKTSSGIWPIDGIVPLAAHLDTIGLIGASVGDVALVHNALRQEKQTLPANMFNLRLGRPASYFYRGLDEVVHSKMQVALSQLRAAGAVIEDVEVPEAAAREHYFPIVLPAHLISLLGRERFVAQRDIMDPLVAARGEKGLDVLAADLLVVETRRFADIVKAAERLANSDAWITPTTTVVSPPVEELKDHERNWALSMGMTQNSQPINYLDMCAITVPLPAEGPLQVGLQIIVRHGGERRALSIAAAVERVLNEQRSGRASTLLAGYSVDGATTGPNRDTRVG